MALSNTYIPSSMSKSYVESKRTPQGTRGYLQAEQELDIQKQSALQNLEQQYASTIENAYASYLQNQRNIGMSQMGEGYKQLYREQQEQQLASNIAQTNLSASQARQELGLQTEEAKAQLEQVKQTEISNLNRVQNTMQQYLDYVKSMQENEGIQLLTEEQQNMYIDDLYETLYDLPVAGTPVSRYSDWVRSNLTGSEADTVWGDWLFSGGLQDFMNAIKQTRTLETKPKEELKPYGDTGYTEETAPAGYVGVNSNITEFKNNDIITNEKTGEKYQLNISTNITNPKHWSTYKVTWENTEKDLSGITLEQAKNLALGTIIEGKTKTWIYLGNKSGYPTFGWLNKTK